MYIFYGGFCVVGFVVWARTREQSVDGPQDPAVEAVA